MKCIDVPICVYLFAVSIVNGLFPHPGSLVVPKEFYCTSAIKDACNRYLSFFYSLRRKLATLQSIQNP
jgi:hypothetical protein